ncbi:CBS domain-containing protein [Aliikangiella maris]|uniref:CBS domain-containing protein n=2 Tax=Aliikangiella maris TaxID=3162458 RepID=A0ABV3MJK1_9GAMM
MPEIREIMTKAPFFLSQQANVNRARMLMAEKKIRHIPIKDAETGKLIGILGQKAVLANAISIVSQHGFEQLVHREKSIDIASIMNTQPDIAQADTPVYQVADLLLHQRNGCVAILENEKLVGIVTSRDFVKLAANNI